MPHRWTTNVALAAIVMLLGLGAPGSAQTPDTLPRRIQLGATLANVGDSARVAGESPGVRVLAVIAGSAAAAADLRTGDVITRIGNDTVHDLSAALALLRPIRTGMQVPLRVIRDGTPNTLSLAARERPRETSTEFTIEYASVSAQGGVRRVLVTHPRDHDRHAAILLIGGIGCFSIDAPSGPMAYRDLLYHLTRQGYTTVRVEKAGVGDSEGASCFDTDFRTELDGYRAALHAMRDYASVDPSRIVLLGHSIGGLEAPMLAAEDSARPRVRGIAVLSTVGVGWYEYELANLRRQLRLQSLPLDTIEPIMALKTTCGFHFLVERESRASLLARVPACAPRLSYPVGDAYMQQVGPLNPGIVWRGVHVPVLAMWGTSDFITSRDEQIGLVAELNAAHAGTASYADIPELDHYLSHQPTARASLVDPVIGLSRPYYGATLEPVLDSWLAGVLDRRD